MSHDTRKPYTGQTRSLVIALDVGTTFSGVSYAILEPGEIPKIHGVTRFPGQEHVAGNSKIPSVMYYDKAGHMKAAGAEADTSSIQSLAEDEEWIKVELFKLRLRPRTMKLDMNGMRLGPLPNGKTAVHVFGDFLAYLYRCTKNFIRDTHANGSALWAAVEQNIQFVLSHPNGWEGAQQTKMRRSTVFAGMIPDTNQGKARIRFVTEGEASLHACVLNGLASDVLSDSSSRSAGFLVADAGGGTLDISSYRILETHPLVIEEIAPPDCIFAGSVFVSRRAREFLLEKLKNSKYGSPDAVDHITKRFDETTKRLFRDKRDPQFIPFGSPLDKDLTVGIRSGQLKLTGEEVAELFEPSIKAAVSAIKSQIRASNGIIRSVFLVGGYAASAWLFSQLQKRLEPYGVSVSRPDTQTSKAVADGAIGFYCDHHVSTRMSKFMYGVEYLREYDSKNPDHVKRKDRLCELPSGPKLLLDAFDCILTRGIKVNESTVFSRKYSTELTSLSTLSLFEVEIWCYRGGNTKPDWIVRDAEDFSTLCLVRADLSPLSGSAQSKTGKNGKEYWTIIFSVEIHFGLTEFKARIKWMDNGAVKYGPASIIYNERGHRADEDEPDLNPEDDITSTPGALEYDSKTGSRARSRPGSVATSQRTSMWGTPKHDTAPVPGGFSDGQALYSDANRTRSEISSSDSHHSSRRSHRESDSASRGRARDKGKEREDVARSHRDSTSTRGSSGLADALSSVWGSLTSSSAPHSGHITPQQQPNATASVSGRSRPHSPVGASRGLFSEPLPPPTAPAPAAPAMTTSGWGQHHQPPTTAPVMASQPSPLPPQDHYADESNPWDAAPVSHSASKAGTTIGASPSVRSKTPKTKTPHPPPVDIAAAVTAVPAVPSGTTPRTSMPPSKLPSPVTHLSSFDTATTPAKMPGGLPDSAASDRYDGFNPLSEDQLIATAASPSRELPALDDLGANAREFGFPPVTGILDMLGLGSSRTAAADPAAAADAPSVTPAAAATPAAAVTSSKHPSPATKAGKSKAGSKATTPKSQTTPKAGWGSSGVGWGASANASPSALAQDAEKKREEAQAAEEKRKEEEKMKEAARAKEQRIEAERVTEEQRKEDEMRKLEQQKEDAQKEEEAKKEEEEEKKRKAEEQKAEDEKKKSDDENKKTNEGPNAEDAQTSALAPAETINTSSEGQDPSSQPDNAEIRADAGAATGDFGTTPVEPSEETATGTPAGDATPQTPITPGGDGDADDDEEKPDASNAKGRGGGGGKKKGKKGKKGGK